MGDIFVINWRQQQQLLQFMITIKINKSWLLPKPFDIIFSIPKISIIIYDTVLSYPFSIAPP